ncbi:MAG: c-type cytochrome [Gammaproteobacteria bacterium]|nr:c-type cytochrome [Gammaproteobacteria bacterium]
MTVIVLCSVSLVTASPVVGADLPPHELLISRVDAAGGVRQAQQESMSEGRRLAEACDFCHGIDGNKSRKDMGLQVPNLASQQPLYLLRQLKNFASKRRLQPNMHRVSTELNDDQRVTLSLYFSAIPLQPYQGEMSMADIQSGKEIFQRLCIYCHGKRATGQGAIPRLHGQNPNYIVTNLIRFRDKGPTRAHAGMSAITRNLKDAEIEALSVFLATLSLEAGQ